jgi:hypothetical protein
LLCQVAAEYGADLDARHALMGLIVRMVDEMRFGLREIDPEEVRTIASAWSLLNDGMTGAEIALRHLDDSRDDE